MLRIEVSELEREIQVTRKLIPEMPQLAEKILALQRQLSAEKEARCRSHARHVCVWGGGSHVAQVTEKLCADLETPANEVRGVAPVYTGHATDARAQERWRPLGGTDPDEEHLIVKVRVCVWGGGQ